MKKDRLRVFGRLPMPLAAVTQTFAFLGKRGSGKTYAAGRFAEELDRVGAQTVILDPVGNWYGLRIGADGGEGLSIPVLGGLRGDMPLNKGGGGVVADFVATSGASLILDVSSFRKGERVSFMTEFAEELFHRKKEHRSPVHLIIEEAQTFVPQRTIRGQERMLGAMEDIIKLGRNYGIGVSLLSQRPQSVNKDALNQTEVLVLFQLVAAHERKAVEDWIRHQGLERETREALDDLSRLPVGEAWVWSPQFLDTLRRVRVLEKQTLDASATPELGQEAPTAADLSQVDLDSLRGRLAEATKEAEARDPKVLQKRIRELEHTLHEVQAAEPEPERIEVPILDEGTKTQLSDLAACLTAAAEGLQEEMEARGQAIVDACNMTAKLVRTHMERPKPEQPRRSSPPTARRANARQTERPAGAASLKAGQVRMIEALASRQDGVLNKAQLGTLAGFSPRGGTFGNYLRGLRSERLVLVNGETVTLTAAGFDEADSRGVMKTLDRAEALTRWMGQLKKGQRRMLMMVLANPDGMSREELGEATDFEPSGGTFGNYLRGLRANCLVFEEDGLIYPNSELLP